MVWGLGIMVKLLHQEQYFLLRPNNRKSTINKAMKN